MIKKKREELGMTQETLAELAEVSVRTVQRAEKGDRINIEGLKTIARVIDLSWKMLIEKDSQLKVIQEEFSKQANRLENSIFFRNKEILDIMIELGSETISEKVIDLACGPGILTEALSKNHCKVTALDITKEMLDIVREKNLHNVEILRGDANKLPFNDNSFKGSFTRLSLHHFEYPEKVIGEMKRITENKGTIIIGDILATGTEKDKELHNSIEKLRDPSHTRCLSKDEIISLGEKIDLELCEYKELEFERELKEWTNISGTEIYKPLYSILKNLISHNELTSMNLHIRNEKIYFTHTWGFFKFKKI